MKNARLILGIAILLTLALAACGPGGETATTAPTPPPATATPSGGPVSAGVTQLSVGQGFGFSKGFWQVYFNAPSGSADESTYVNGIDNNLAAALNAAQSTIDVAAFEFNDVVLTQALLDANSRGLTVRIVTDDDNGINADDTTLTQLQDAGIPIVNDARSGLMHNKFMIIDSTVVWTGSWNYTVYGTYRNNNNALVLRSQRAVQAYQAEFNEMFVDHKFGKTSPTGNGADYTQDGTPIQILFASEDPVVDAIINTINQSTTSIDFMAFVFTQDQIGQAVLDKIGAGVPVRGIFDSRQATTRFSELQTLQCAGGQMRIDGNPYVLHNKVFIIDNSTVITGSFNFSDSAAESNDENLVIITDPDLAALYTTEFERRWAEATNPENINCN